MGVHSRFRYVVNYSWFERWRKHVRSSRSGLKSGAEAAAGPGAVDNGVLLESGTTSIERGMRLSHACFVGSWRPLKNLEEGRDYVLVSREHFTQLVQIHGMMQNQLALVWRDSDLDGERITADTGECLRVAS